MYLIPYIIEFLFNKRKTPLSILRILVGVFLIISGLFTGGYFLFNYVAPIIGYYEAGLVCCLLLTIVGIAFLKIPSRQKEADLSFSHLIQNFPSQEVISGFIKNNEKKIFLLTAIGGILLLQLLKSHKSK